MPSYHVSHDGVRRACRAKPGNCHFGAEVHFSSAASADEYLTLLQDTIQDRNARKKTVIPPTSAHPTVHQALTAALGYAGPAPAWWDGIVAEARGHKSLACEPELLDLIDSPAGRVAVVWQRNSLDDNDRTVIEKRGMNVRLLQLRHVETGEQLGYLKLSNVDEASLRRSFGDDEFTPFRYRAALSGSGYFYEKDDLAADPTTLTSEALHEMRRRMWVAAQRDVLGRNGWPQNAELTDAPTDAATLDAELSGMAWTVRQEMAQGQRRNAMSLVDFSRVEEPLLGSGLGSAMYVYAARRLAQENLAVKASKVQTDEAEAVWARFQQLLPNQVTTHRYLTEQGKRREDLLLDFR